MSGALPPEDLECPVPSECPVPVEDFKQLCQSGAVPVTSFLRSRPWCRIYSARSGYSHPNPGYGDTRFAPFNSLKDGRRIPTFYLVEDLESACFETVLHSISLRSPRVIDEIVFFGMAHATIQSAENLSLADLRDDALATLGLSRDQISSTDAEHYPCTRKVAQMIHSYGEHPDHQRIQGMVWHSKQSEFNGLGAKEVTVIFTDRLRQPTHSWTLLTHRSSSGSLLEGFGRLRIDEIAENLGLIIESSEIL